MRRIFAGSSESAGDCFRQWARRPHTRTYRQHHWLSAPQEPPVLNQSGEANWGTTDEVGYVAFPVMTADDVLEIVGWLRASGVDVWLLGGWGVDALVGEQTRDHKDLDLIVRDDDVARASDVLNERGFRMERGAEGGVIFRDGRDRVVDLHSVRFDDRGNGHFENENRGSFEHPAGAFAATGNIAGQRVACLSAEAQVTNHAWGYTLDEDDFHDMRLLHDRLGTPLLPRFSDRSGA